MDRKKIVLSLLGIALVAAGAGWYLYNAKTPTAADQGPDVSVDATALYAAFTQDEVAAGKLYNDKVLQVSGTVREVAVDPKGPVNITLETGDALGAVVCEFAPGEAPDWKKDAQVSLKGFCSGYNLDVLLQRCAAVE